MEEITHSAYEPPLLIPSNCVVREGEAVEVALTLSVPLAASLQGQFRFEGVELEGWVASLVPKDAHAKGSNQPPAPAWVDARGDFEVRASQGAFDLRLRGPGGGALELWFPVTLKAGKNRWERTLQSTTLHVVTGREGTGLAFEASRADGMRVSTFEVKAGPDETVDFGLMPAGPGRVLILFEGLRRGTKDVDLPPSEVTTLEFE